MSALAILDELHRQDVAIRLDGRHVRLRAAPGSTLEPDLIERVRAAKPALVAHLSSVRAPDAFFVSGPAGEWQRSLDAIDPVRPPCPGFREWPSVRKHALRFLDERGEEAVSLGWGVLDLFGVHCEVGTIRSDCCGALLGLTGRPVVELTSHLLRFSDGLAYRRRPMLATITIPIWEFRR